MNEVPPIGDEGAFYFTAREFDAPRGIVHDLYVPLEEDAYANVRYRPIPIFWYRPAHFLVLAPAAELGMDVFRIWNLALTSLIPVLAVLVLQQHAIRAPAAFGAGVALAVIPYVVFWSVITLPDALMTTWFLAGYWVHLRGRNLLGGLCFLAAAWTKETAMIGLIILLAESLVARWRQGDPSVWPLRLTKRETALLAALLLGPLPLVYAMASGGAAPGGAWHPTPGPLVDHLFLTPWFVIPIVLGLWDASARRLAALSLGLAMFYLGYNTILGRGVPEWYLFMPIVVTTLALAATLDRRHAAAAGLARRRRAASIAMAMSVVIMLVIVAMPAGAGKAYLVAPLSGRADRDIWEWRRDELRENQQMQEAFGKLALGPGETVLAIDVYGSYVLHPLASSGSTVILGDTRTTDFLRQRLDPWAARIEANTTQTILAKQAGVPLNEAVLETYRECIVFEDAWYAIITGGKCPGRLDLLSAEYEARRSD